MTIPRLPAVRVDTDPEANTLNVWCEWCEGLHQHGGPYGLRARHCATRSGNGSPYCTYEVVEGRTGKAATEALPAALFVGTGHMLHKAIRRRGAELRRVLARIMLGERERQGPTFCRTGRRGAVEVEVVNRLGYGSSVEALPVDDWRFTAPDGRERDGRGLLDLAALLFGVSPGVVAVRALEATLGFDLDAEAAADVCAAVAAWDARGRPGPKVGTRTRA